MDLNVFEIEDFRNDVLAKLASNGFGINYRAFVEFFLPDHYTYDMRKDLNHFKKMNIGDDMFWMQIAHNAIDISVLNSNIKVKFEYLTRGKPNFKNNLVWMIQSAMAEEINVFMANLSKNVWYHSKANPQMLNQLLKIKENYHFKRLFIIFFATFAKKTFFVVKSKFLNT